MTFDPTQAVAEILGEPSAQMRNPANAEYECPFLNSVCTKRSTLLQAPYPVCSVHRAGVRGAPRTGPPICTCPYRFYEAQLQEDVLREAWKGPRPANPQIAYEVSMQKFGRVDFVVADYDEHSKQVRKFLPVELQAVDITGSVYPAYDAILNSKELPKRPSYGLNWSNVRKRYITQLIQKGFYCHHWDTRIVAVLQSDLFQEFQKHAKMDTVPLADANIVFMLYQYRWVYETQRWDLALEHVVPTSHTSVMNAILYQTPPNKDTFEKRILSRIQRPEGPIAVPVVETIGEIEPEPDESDEDE